MKKRTIIIGIFILFLVGVISIIGTYAIDSTITEGNSSTADYLFNITLGDRTNREVVIPSYDSKIVDIKISNPNEFTMSYLLYIEGVNSNISVINIKDTEASGVLASKTTAIIQVFIQNNSSSDITIKIKDIVGFEKETLTLPDNSTSINKGNYYKVVVKSNNNTYGKVKPNIKLSTLNGIVKYEIVPNTGYEYKSTTCSGSVVNNTLTISNITSNVNCEVVFEPIEVTVSFDGNMFSTSSNSITSNGLTITYDSATSYLTVNGTPTSSSIILDYLLELTFTEGDKYNTKLTYISGNVTNTGTSGGKLVIDIFNSSKSSISTRNYSDTVLANKNTDSTLTVNSAGASEGTVFQYRFWFATPADWTFTNYKVKVDVTKNESKMVSFGSTYGPMPTPKRSGYTFVGWYTGENGTGTKITSSSVVSTVSNHTLYAYWLAPINVSFDTDGGSYNISTTYTEAKEHTYTVPYSGTYKLEVWGAQGGNAICNGSSCSNRGGYGGYATGEVYLTKNQQIFANVGGQGSNGKLTSAGAAGGYNGGGSGTWDNNDDEAAGGGGGATHIANKSGLLSALSNNIPDVLIVAGGGGGASWTYATGNGGGYVGGHTSTTNTSYPTQTSGYSFGQGQNGSGAANSDGVGGGGGGFYGGYANNIYNKSSGTGGSGYIGNSLLSNKYMYCYECDTSDEVNTKTYTTTNVSSTPTTNYAKSGAGAAKITLKNVNNTINYGEKYSNLPIPTKSGYIFLGWYTEPNGQGTKVTEDTVLTNTSDHTLYASWGSINEYTTSGSYTFTVPKSGLYKLEVWGAQGGSGMVDGVTKYAGGYGGYSKGDIYLETDTILYISVGGQGGNATDAQSGGAGGYNGGGKGGNDSNYTSSGGNEPGGGGGGATHIATSSGLLSTLSSSTSSILVVAGGGGGSAYYGAGGSGGGINGTYGNSSSTIFGTQTSGNSFGLGGDGIAATGGAGGGGAGYYGGGGGQSDSTSGGGGSGYIGNSLLKAKYMYCYNCTTSDEVNTKTYTTTNVSSTPTANYAKSGSGAVKITFLGEDAGPPVGSISASKDYNNINVSINATDDKGIDHYEYYLSTSTTCPTEGYTISSSNSYTYNITETGTYYVCARVADISGNILSLKSGAITYSRIYSVAIRYNTNGGTITPNTSSYTWTTDDTGLIYQNGKIYEQVIRYETPADLANYNNSNFINITPPDDLNVVSGSEWICLSGCSVANKKFNQTTEYNTSDFCDVTDNNCTVVLGLNLVGDTTAPTCTLSANSSTITASASDTGGSGLVYNGWSSSYSGSNSTSKSIATGTHTYYVKDGAGNTGSCSITIAGTTKSCPSGYWLENNDTICYKGWYVAKGSCNCRNNEGTSVSCLCKVSGSSAVAQCQSLALGAAVVSNSCYSGIDYVTADISYTCSSGYTKINNSYCYKTS